MFFSLSCKRCKCLHASLKSRVSSPSLRQNRNFCCDRTHLANEAAFVFLLRPIPPNTCKWSHQPLTPSIGMFVPHSDPGRGGPHPPRSHSTKKKRLRMKRNKLSRQHPGPSAEHSLFFCSESLRRRTRPPPFDPPPPLFTSRLRATAIAESLELNFFFLCVLFISQPATSASTSFFPDSEELVWFLRSRHPIP